MVFSFLGLVINYIVSIWSSHVLPQGLTKNDPSGELSLPPHPNLDDPPLTMGCPDFPIVSGNYHCSSALNLPNLP